MTRLFLVFDDPSLAADIHELLSKANEVTSRDQKCNRRFLWWLDVVPEDSKASSLKNLDIRASKPPPKPAGTPEELFSFRWESKGTAEDEEKRDQGQDQGENGRGSSQGRGRLGSAAMEPEWGSGQ